jgi:hypothetical protein
MEEKIEKAIKKLKKQRFLSKNRVIDELFKDTNNNSGILETSCVLSLKCPVSRTRIKTPIRFHHCKHAQCFDANSFFQLTLSSVIKKCPICNLQANYNSLIVDGLFYEILKNTSNLDEQVVLYSNGNWEVKDENDNDNRYITSYNNKTYNYKIDDDNYYSIDNFNSSRNENVSNNKNKYNVVYNYRIIDDNTYYLESERKNSKLPDISFSSYSSKKIDDNDYLENTKKIFLDDLSCLNHETEETSFQNEEINNINEQLNENITINDQINIKNNSNDNNNVENDGINENVEDHYSLESCYKNDINNINEKVKTIQEITDSIQKILNISINEPETVEEIKDKEEQNILNNTIDKDEIKINMNKDDYNIENNSNIIINNDDILKSSSSEEFKKKFNSIERDIENSRKKKESLLERSKYISTKYIQEQPKKIISTTVRTSGKKPTIIQLKKEKIHDHEKSKLVYYYKIV